MGTPTGATPATSKNNRGKDQIHWGEGVWKTLDHAVLEEMLRTRVAAKFLPHVHVERKQTNVAADVVVSPVQAALAAQQPTPSDTALFVDESLTNRIQEYWVTFRMSVAQVEEEEHAEAAMGHHPEATSHEEPGTAAHHHMMHSQRASTGVSLAMRTANILAQVEDLVLFNGQNAAVNSPLFITQQVQALDQNLKADLDLGLLNIKPLFASPPGSTPINNDIQLPASQVIPVHPTAPANGVFPPTYAENTLNAVASAFSSLQGLGHYEHYALALHTVPYADLHQALKTTLIEPVEPISHLIKAGIHGTGTLPPFTQYPPAGVGFPPPTAQVIAAGLPTSINGGPLAKAGKPNTSPINGFLNPPEPNGTQAPVPNILYTGVLVSLSGNTMDHVRGRMEDHLDVIVTFNQKDANEQYRFRVVERFALRLKDPTAVIVFLFLDS